MATKLTNSSLYNIILNANRYYTPDVYLNLIHLSSEFKLKEGNKKVFLIQTGEEDKNTLVRVIKEHTGLNRQTITNCLEEIQELGLISYNHEVDGFELLGMDKIGCLSSISSEENDESVKLAGYTNLRDFFLTKEFSNLKLREKKLLMYMSHLADSISGKKFSKFQPADFVINVLNEASVWRKILRTSSKYYAKYVIEAFIVKVPQYIEDKTEEIRKTVLKPKSRLEYMFYVNSIKIKEKFVISTAMEIKYGKELYLINEYVQSFGISVSEQHKYQLAHSVGCLSNWDIKDLVIKEIMKKFKAEQVYKSRERIKSIPAYTASVIKNVISIYRTPKEDIIPDLAFI
ncbi:hypothetical protein [Clostridium sp.]|uniref:hypothetical protein n=1 Tax=Clostridium sp. TaxID=1506 RepID=UPI001B45522A|nr:hypothetical protein [Clostridium sp.]MBP3915033.1 hypothetical protein [Clostridium sp.]